MKYHIVFFFVIIFIFACSQKTEEIKYDSDECAYCTMQIRDNKYAAEIVSDDGTAYKFDSIECLIGFALVKNIVEDESQKFYVNDFMKPGNFIDARNSYFVHNKNFSSPMGLNVQAFASETEQENFIKENGGEKISWENVIELVKKNEM